MASGRYFHCARRGCSASKTYVVPGNAFQASPQLIATLPYRPEAGARGGAPASGGAGQATSSCSATAAGAGSVLVLRMTRVASTAAATMAIALTVNVVDIAAV